MSKTTSSTADVKQQLNKIKKLITANNPDSFALALDLARTLEMDNEATWLGLLAKSRIVQLGKLNNNRVTNLLLEIAGRGKSINKLVLENLPAGRQYRSLYLQGLTTLSDAAAQALARHKGYLSLSGLTSLSDGAAEALAQHKREL